MRLGYKFYFNNNNNNTINNNCSSESNKQKFYTGGILVGFQSFLAGRDQIDPRRTQYGTRPVTNGDAMIFGSRFGAACSSAGHKEEGKKRAGYFGCEEKKIMEVESKRRRKEISSPAAALPINSLDDGCLMHVFSVLSPIPDRYNTVLVCHRWSFLACHPRLWLRVERPIKNLTEPGVYTSLEAAISTARPGDTILIAAGGNHVACNIQIKKPICLIGAGDLPDDTVLTLSAFEFLSTCKVASLTIIAELGCCLLHRSGRLTIEGCILQ